MKTGIRKPFVVTAAVAVAVAAGAACTLLGPCPAARADGPMADKGMAGDPKMMAMAHVDQMKQMAADPMQAQVMAAAMAKMMVMDRMAEEMAKDPKFQQAAMAAMTDPNMMKVHDDAMKMAADPEQMKKMQQEVSADPAAMKMVEHKAMMMATMKDKMTGTGGQMMDHGAPMMGGDKK
jgi:hypothetical protein